MKFSIEGSSCILNEEDCRLPENASLLASGSSSLEPRLGDCRRQSCSPRYAWTDSSSDGLELSKYRCSSLLISRVLPLLMSIRPSLEPSPPTFGGNIPSYTNESTSSRRTVSKERARSQGKNDVIMRGIGTGSFLWRLPSETNEWHLYLEAPAIKAAKVWWEGELPFAHRPST